MDPQRVEAGSELQAVQKVFGEEVYIKRAECHKNTFDYFVCKVDTLLEQKLSEITDIIERADSICDYPSTNFYDKV